MSTMCSQCFIHTVSLGITGWKYFTCLKLCKCSQILHPSPRVKSTPQQSKSQPPLAESSTTNPRHTKLCYLTCCRSEGKLSNSLGNTRKSLPIPLINTRNRKIKNSATAGTKRRTHLLGR